MTSFKTKAELEAHYTATRARLWGDFHPPQKRKSSERKIKEIPPVRSPEAPQYQKIITTLDRLRAIASAHGFRYEELRGPVLKRTNAQVAARRDIMKYLSEEKGWSNNRIAKTLALDHTSVMNGLEKLREGEQSEPQCESKPDIMSEPRPTMEPQSGSEPAR